MVRHPDPRRLVDPELLPLLDLLPAGDYVAETLAEARARQFPKPPNPDNGVTMTTRVAPGPDSAPDVQLLVYRPPVEGRLPCILHLHGGGYVMGAARHQEAAHRALAGDLNCVIVSVDYRLAPEAPFPAPLEDCYAALAWLWAASDELGVDRATIGVMGESAGGGLAAALALLARDCGEYDLAFQHLIYPMLDDRTGTAEPTHPHAGHFVWTAVSNRFGWSALLGREVGGVNVPRYFAPAREADLSRLPSTFVSTGALDLFVEEDVAYATRLMRAGVAVELHVYPGAFHAFDMMRGAGVADAAVRDSKAALARQMRRPGA